MNSQKSNETLLSWINLLDKFEHPCLQSCTELESRDAVHYHIEWIRRFNFEFDKSVTTRVNNKTNKEANFGGMFLNIKQILCNFNVEKLSLFVRTL